MNREVPWEFIHSQKFFTIDKCWTKCGGGFCCSNNYSYFSTLRFIPTQGTTILYMEDEYNYLFQKGKAHPGQRRILSLDFGAEKPLRVIYVTCQYMGHCKDIIEPPLLCKLYPLIPIISIDGDIEALYEASIFELTFKIRGKNSPCAIKKECAHFYNQWNSESPLLQLLRHPYIILYLKAAKSFADIYTQKLKMNTRLMNLKEEDFWQEWEFYYLSGQLIDIDLLKQEVAEVYRELKQKYVDFSL